MTKPTLYLFIGYPGAGKTTVAQIISEATGAVHLWADRERHELFAAPTHSEQESLQLYDHLNRRTAELLVAGQSVIFDTNFNNWTDRQKLRDIAARTGAVTEVIWVGTPASVAKQRAVYSGAGRNGYDASMTEEKFDQIVATLEMPRADERIIKLDGTKIDKAEVLALIG